MNEKLQKESHSTEKEKLSLKPTKEMAKLRPGPGLWVEENF